MNNRWHDGKNVFEPLFVELFKVAIPVIKAYHSDLGHDAIMLSNALAGDCFLWGYRESGTHLARVTDENMSDMHKLMARSDTIQWFFLRVTKHRHSQGIDGTMIPINSSQELISRWHETKDLSATVAA